MKNDPLLARVLAAPHDVDARMVYADALQEKGDPRGEFIQLQLRAESLPVGDDARLKAERAASKIEKTHRRAWLAELPMVRQGTFRGGLLDGVTATADDFFDGIDELLTRAPVRGVKLTKLKKPHLARLAKLLASRALTHLDLSANRLDGPQLAQLFAKADLSRLESLALVDDPIGEEGAKAIASRSPSRLVELHLGGSMCGRPGDAALGALLGIRPAPPLRRLSLSYFGVTAAGARALAASPILATVEELDLQSNSIGDDGVTALATSKHLKRVRRLHLGHSNMTDKGARALLGSPILDHIEKDPTWALLLWDRNDNITKTTRAKLDARLGDKVIGW